METTKKRKVDVEEVDFEEELQKKLYRTVAVPPPTPHTVWVPSLKRWIDWQVTNWYKDFYHKSHNERVMEKRRHHNSKCSPKWNPGMSDRRNEEAWRNGWLDFNALIQQVKSYGELDECELLALELQKSMTKNQIDHYDEEYFDDSSFESWLESDSE